jgi:hypothetical protein
MSDREERLGAYASRQAIDTKLEWVVNIWKGHFSPQAYDVLAGTAE